LVDLGDFGARLPYLKLPLQPNIDPILFGTIIAQGSGDAKQADSRE
jgi:hypothetical protein